MADDDQQAMAILTQMSQSQSANKTLASPGAVPLPFRGPTSSAPAPPLSPSSARSPGPPLASIRTNPALFRPDPPGSGSAAGGYPSTSGSTSESYLSRAPVAGSSNATGAGAFTKLPPIDAARSRQNSVALRSLPPSRQTSVEPTTEGEDELASPQGAHSLLGKPPVKKRLSGGGPEGGLNGTPETDGTPAPAVDWTRTRKDNHKEVERRRRETINEGINDLKQIVPGCEKNKGSILQRAVEYINELKEVQAKNVEKWTLEALLNEQASAELKHELDNYKRHLSLIEQDNFALRTENDALRAELGRPPLGPESIGQFPKVEEMSSLFQGENGVGKRTTEGEREGSGDEKRPRIE